MSYTQNFTVQVRNAGVAGLYWDATVEVDALPAWPDGSGLSISPEAIQGPVAFDDTDELIVTFTAVDGMLKASSPYTGTLTLRGYEDRNKITAANTVVQTCNLHIFTGGILAYVGDLEFKVHVDETGTTDRTTEISNTGDVSLDWNADIALNDGELTGKLVVDVDAGTLAATASTTITMTLSNPSTLGVGTYTGNLRIYDNDGWSDSLSIPITVEVFSDVTESYCIWYKPIPAHPDASHLFLYDGLEDGYFRFKTATANPWHLFHSSDYHAGTGALVDTDWYIETNVGSRLASQHPSADWARLTPGGTWFSTLPLTYYQVEYHGPDPAQ